MSKNIHWASKFPFTDFDPLSADWMPPWELPMDLFEIARRARRILRGVSHDELLQLTADVDYMDARGTHAAIQKAHQEAELYDEHVAWVTDLDRVRACLDNPDLIEQQSAPNPTYTNYLATLALMLIGRLVSVAKAHHDDGEEFHLSEGTMERAADAREAVSIAEGMLLVEERRKSLAKKASGQRWEDTRSVRAICIRFYSDLELEGLSNAKAARAIFEKLSDDMKLHFDSYKEPELDPTQAQDTIARWISKHKNNQDKL